MARRRTTPSGTTRVRNVLLGIRRKRRRRVRSRSKKTARGSPTATTSPKMSAKSSVPPATSALGRFLSRDPIAEQGGLNLYAFVQNNPNVFFDERGGAMAALIPIAIMGIIAIGVIGIIGVISTPKPQPIPSPEIPDIPLPDLGETTVTLCACVLACLAKGVSVAQDVADTCKRADPGDCTKEQHAELQKAVNETKGEKRCLPSDTCATLYAKETKWSKQAIARQIINNTCYKGGDSGHKQALEQAQINVRNCAGIIARKCMA